MYPYSYERHDMNAVFLSYAECFQRSNLYYSGIPPDNTQLTHYNNYYVPIQVVQAITRCDILR